MGNKIWNSPIHKIKPTDVHYAQVSGTFKFRQILYEHRESIWLCNVEKQIKNPRQKINERQYGEVGIIYLRIYNLKGLYDNTENCCDIGVSSNFKTNNVILRQFGKFKCVVFFFSKLGINILLYCFTHSLFIRILSSNFLLIIELSISYVGRWLVWVPT